MHARSLVGPTDMKCLLKESRGDCPNASQDPRYQNNPAPSAVASHCRLAQCTTQPNICPVDWLVARVAHQKAEEQKQACRRGFDGGRGRRGAITKSKSHRRECWQYLSRNATRGPVELARLSTGG